MAEPVGCNELGDPVSGGLRPPPPPPVAGVKGRSPAAEAKSGLRKFLLPPLIFKADNWCFLASWYHFITENYFSFTQQGCWESLGHFVMGRFQISKCVTRDGPFVALLSHKGC